MKKLSIILILSIFLSGCVTSYHIQVFSDDVQSLPYKIITTTTQKPAESHQPQPTETTKETIIVEGLFKGKSYEEAMRAASKEGFTKVLSVEYGTRHVLWTFSFKWVEIRCVK